MKCSKRSLSLHRVTIEDSGRNDTLNTVTIGQIVTGRHDMGRYGKGRIGTSRSRARARTLHLRVIDVRVTYVCPVFASVNDRRSLAQLRLGRSQSHLPVTASCFHKGK